MFIVVLKIQIAIGFDFLFIRCIDAHVIIHRPAYTYNIVRKIKRGHSCHLPSGAVRFANMKVVPDGIYTCRTNIKSIKFEKLEGYKDNSDQLKITCLVDREVRAKFLASV